MRLLFVVLVVSSSAALGQTLQLRIQERDSLTVGTNDCDAEIPVTWSVTGASVNPCEPLRLWVTTASACGNEPAAPPDLLLREVPVESVLNPAGFRVTFRPRDLPTLASAEGGGGCGTGPGVELVHRLCGRVRFTDAFGTSCGVTATDSSPPTLTYDSKPPDAPAITEVLGRDSSLAVRASPQGTGTVLLRAVARRQGSTDVAGQAEGTVQQGSYVVQGLENGVTYEVTVVAEDEAGNESAASAPVLGTPVRTSGFFEIYRGAGGSETGGCGAAGGGIAGGAVLAALGLWLFARRGRSWLEQ